MQCVRGWQAPRTGNGDNEYHQEHWSCVRGPFHVRLCICMYSLPKRCDYGSYCAIDILDSISDASRNFHLCHTPCGSWAPISYPSNTSVPLPSQPRFPEAESMKRQDGSTCIEEIMPPRWPGTIVKGTCLCRVSACARS